MNRLHEKLIERVRRGPITFAEFMEAALYDPEYGYYSSGTARIGPEGDYITSPATSPVFGKTLARLVDRVDEIIGWPKEFTVLEPGAGSGRTAAEIIAALKNHSPELFERLHYIGLERTERQRDVLKSNLEYEKCFEAACNLDEIKPVVGMVLSNEFFDALPMHRLVMREGRIREIYIGEKDGQFVDVEGEPGERQLSEYFEWVGVKLLDGQFADVSLDWARWMERLAQKIESGVMISIDYGYPSRELFSPVRYRGTLMAYKGHEVSENLYADPGEQDLTAHVDFTALALAGKRGGLEPLALTDQLRLFLKLGIDKVLAEMEAESTDFTQFQLQVQSAKALIMPGGLGETFKVLVQQKGLDREVVEKLKKLIQPKYDLGL